MFKIHTYASTFQLGAVISQEGKPIAFYSRKLTDIKQRYTVTEKELISVGYLLPQVPKIPQLFYPIFFYVRSSTNCFSQ